MGNPGGGRNPVSERLLSHSMLVSMNNFDNNTMVRIYTKLMKWHCTKNNFSDEISFVLESTIAGSVEVFKQAQSYLKPTPAKCHYIYNIRDLSRVIQGVQMLSKEEATDGDKVLKLWAHEVCRVFGDRLVSDEDEVWFYEMIYIVCRDKNRDDLERILRKAPDCEAIQAGDLIKYLVFGDIMGDGVSAHDRHYDEVPDFNLLLEKANSFLEDYNSMSKKPMHLVLFDDAVRHIMRISRMLRLSKGNALLIGLGGSGRQSLTKISSFICDFEISQFEVSKSYGSEEWKEDVKKLLLQVGVEGK
jgi:dynein heavy chain